MPLPPEAIYPSREALFEAIQAWAYPYGYSFTTGKSRRMEGSRRWRVVYCCDRYCHHTTTISKRTTSSRSTGCEFSVLAVETIDKQSWQLKHRPDTKFSTHNHAPSLTPAAHSSHRRMPPYIQNINQELYNAGMYLIIRLRSILT